MNSKADDGSKVIRNLSDLFNSLKAKNKKKKNQVYFKRLSFNRSGI